MKRIILFLAIVASHFGAGAQPLMSKEANTPPMKEQLLMLNKARYVSAGESEHGAAKTTYAAGKVFDTTKWAYRIDSTWGAGAGAATQLDLFNQFWLKMDSFYAGFVGRPLYNWDLIVNNMRAEISTGVSKGRFAGIIGKLIAYINDGHSNFYDRTVSYGSAVYPGLPVFRGESGLFGACITTVAGDDSTPVVYSADAGHPFGLQKGDVILGYNHMPWKRLVGKIMDYEMPVGMYRAATEAATWHRYTQAAGENWYLFDTINIQKCGGGLVNFPTSLMIGTHFQDLCLEELPVAGVHTRTYTDYATYNRITCSGVITGTRIGYVSFLDCLDVTGDSLYNAVRALVEDSLVHGLVIDIRSNYGGSFLAFFKTFKYLNKGDVSWLGEGLRSDPTNRYLMYNSPSSDYDLPDDDANSFDKKIAILCGPGAGSSGDLFSVLFRHHPVVKTFGKSTEGAYGAIEFMSFTDASFGGSRQLGNFYEASNPSLYLTHTEFPIDSPMWYTRTDLCNGTDNVLNSAVRWIEPKLGVNETAHPGASVSVYPNPATGKINIVIESMAAETISVRLCDAMGATIKIATANLATGTQDATIDISETPLPAGSYFLVLQGNALGTITKKVTLVNK